MTFMGESQESAADELATLRRQVAELEALEAEHRKTEEALRANESLYRGFVEQSLDAIALMDEQGVIVDWNRRAEQLIGLRREDVLGRSGWDVLAPA